ncbi:MAG: hypothetical protein ABI091_26600 [Ferruginibacter sp.]
MEKILEPEVDLIIKALDGRSYRWLALEIKMPETELSKRMNGHIKFSKDELTTINQRLNENLIEKVPIIQE